jgi:hypothetical protein
MSKKIEARINALTITNICEATRFFSGLANAGA